jgi:hypothetical protein
VGDDVDMCQGSRCLSCILRCSSVVYMFAKNDDRDRSLRLDRCPRTKCLCSSHTPVSQCVLRQRRAREDSGVRASLFADQVEIDEPR